MVIPVFFSKNSAYIASPSKKLIKACFAYVLACHQKKKKRIQTRKVDCWNSTTFGELNDFSKKKKEMKIIGFETIPMSSEEKNAILFQITNGDTKSLTVAHFEIGQLLARAVGKALATLHIKTESIDIVASHGQTIWHQVDSPIKGTLQLGEGSCYQKLLGKHVTVIEDFRVRDVAFGGDGAPLMGIFDDMLLRHPTHWRAIQNFGGIGNVTILPPLSQPQTSKFVTDTGPANILIDAWIQHTSHGKLQFDYNGEGARRGSINPEFLDLLQTTFRSFFEKPAPKTTGRELFNVENLKAAFSQYETQFKSTLQPNDVLATLVELTVHSAVEIYPPHVSQVIVSGGGARNSFLMERLQSKAINRMAHKKSEKVEQATCSVMNFEQAFGIDPDCKEGLLFAFLAWFSIQGRALPSPSDPNQTTVIGKITPGDNFLDLMKHCIK